MKFGEHMRQKRARERKGQYFPKGFDITLLGVMAEYDLNEEQQQQLFDLTTKDSNIVYANIGRETYYRRSQMDVLFNEQAKV